MYYVFSGAHISLIWGEVRHMHWGWVSLAVVSNLLAFVLQGWRWQLILTPVESIAVWTCTRCIFLGLFANEILPLRAGELIRCFLLTRWSRVPLSVSFASALIERIFDGIWLMICFFVTLRLVPLPHWLERAGYILGILLVIGGIILAIGMFAQRQSINLIFGFSFPAWFNTLVEDLHLIGHSRYLYYAFAVSGLSLAVQFVPVYSVIKAYRLDLALPFTTAFALTVLLRLSAVVPQAPGNLGLFQGVAARTLTAFHAQSAHAKRFSFVLWAVITAPLIVVGFVLLLFTGINMAHLHRDAMHAAGGRRNGE